MTVWVIEFRLDARSRWVPQSVHETRREAKDSCWVAVSPAEFRIVKYDRREKAR